MVCTQGVLRVSRGQQRISEVGGQCEGTGDAMLGVGFFFPSGFCFTFLTLHSLKTVLSVSESKSSVPPWHASQPASITDCLVSYSAQSGTRHRQQGGVSLIAEAKKGAW